MCENVASITPIPAAFTPIEARQGAAQKILYVHATSAIVGLYLAFGLMAVVIYDAMGVRAETGKQGAVLNRLLHEIVIEGKPITEEKLKELVGHTPLEVLGGVLVGLAMVLIMA